LFKDVNIDIKSYLKEKFNQIDNKTFVEYIEENVGFLKLRKIEETENKIGDETNNSDTSFFSYLKEVSMYQTSFFSSIKNTGKEISQAVSNNIDRIEDITEKDRKNSKTNVVKENNLEEIYNFKYKSVKIKNESKYDLSKINFDKKIALKNKKDIVIYHTHTCESYTKTKKNTYKSSGNYRTTDLKYSVAKVGDVLETYLKKAKFNVIHNKTYHDYPKYNGSYNRSLATLTKIMKTSNASLVIDLHRDAIGRKSSYAPCININGEKVAQVMFVMGTDGGSLTHKNWKRNLRFAVKVQEIANKKYPGFFRPIIVRNSRYNQHIAEGRMYNRSWCNRKHFRRGYSFYEVFINSLRRST